MKKEKYRKIKGLFIIGVLTMLLTACNSEANNSKEENIAEYDIEGTTETEEGYACEEIIFSYDTVAALIKEYPTFIEGEYTKIIYDFENENYQKLIEQYPIRDISGEGTELERVMRLVNEYAPRLIHNSNYDNNSIELNSLALLEFSLDKPECGINCRAKAQILNEMCLALNIYSRVVLIGPYSAVDSDSHVVNEIYDKTLNKWVMVDLTTNGYMVDENDVPLSLVEIRQHVVDGKKLAFVSQGKKYYHGNEIGNYNDKVTYLVKNSFHYTIAKEQSFGGATSIEEFCYFIPKGYDIKKKIITQQELSINQLREDEENKQLVEAAEKNLELIKEHMVVNIGNINAMIDKPY